MSTFIRGANPVWSFVDLTGQQFDDTFYMYVLENTLPYIPATVYHEPTGTPWTNPIQFLANGTLPIDIYWDDSQVYRLEFRQNDGVLPPSQSDPLIYLVENYQPGGTGDTPIDTVGLFTDNQIANPQFSLISFASPYTLTNATDPDPIEVAPGWFLELTGTGNVSLERLALNDSLVNPTNAPYALRITLSGTWSEFPILRQRFAQNGMLWSGRYVSTSITARIEGAPQMIDARLVDSDGTTVASLLSDVVVNSGFEEYTGYGLVVDTTNSDTPPDAWIDYQLLLPTAVDIYVTSFQIIASNLETAFPYEEDTIDRQIDHTWHYYKDDVLLRPKESVLVGWNFPLNPWQFSATTTTTVATPNYYGDQTLIQLENNSSLSVERLTDGTYHVAARSGQTQGKWGLLQFVDSASIRPYWDAVMSSLARMKITTSNGTELGMKMRLLYRSTVPPGVNIISSWNANGTDPTFAAGWTAVAPINDPIYILGANYTSYPFEGFEMPTQPATAAMIGLFLYTDNIMSDAGTPDTVTFQEISLTPSRFAIDTNVQSFDEVLKQCQFYFEKSYDPFVAVGTAGGASPLLREQLGLKVLGNDFARTRAFGIEFAQTKRTTPAVALYSAIAGTLNNVTMVLLRNGFVGNSGNVASTNWTEQNVGKQAVQYWPNNGTAFLTVATSTDDNPDAFIEFHYIANALLGVVA